MDYSLLINWVSICPSSNRRHFPQSVDCVGLFVFLVGGEDDPASMVAMPRSVPAAVAAIPVSVRAGERRNTARPALRPAAGTSSRVPCLCRTN